MLIDAIEEYKKRPEFPDATVFEDLTLLFRLRATLWPQSEPNSWDHACWWKGDDHLLNLANTMASLELKRLEIVFSKELRNPVPVYLALHFADLLDRPLPGWAANFLRQGAKRLRAFETSGLDSDCRSELNMQASDYMRRYLREDALLYAGWAQHFLREEKGMSAQDAKTELEKDLRMKPRFLESARMPELMDRRTTFAHEDPLVRAT